jgi:hypothetical protein
VISTSHALVIGARSGVGKTGVGADRPVAETAVEVIGLTGWARCG